MSIGERLREERKRLDLNLSQFAVIGKVTPQSQSRYEKDERTPDANYLNKISQAVDTYYIVNGTRITPQPTLPRGHSAILLCKNLYASAGFGVINQDDDWDKLIIPDDLLWNIAKVKPSDHLRIIVVEGHSMSPEYKNGDLILVDASVKDFIGTGIYIFKKNDTEVYVKKIQQMIDGKLNITSLNKEYDSYAIDSATDIKLEVLAKVICAWKYEFT